MPSEPARIEAFSDGVFAIAITLVILEIEIPPSGSDLGKLLLKQRPSYLALVLSCAFIGIMWIKHHRMFHSIGRFDEERLILNLLLLFGVSIVPFPPPFLPLTCLVQVPGLRP